MIPELGHFALIVAFCLAVVQGSLPLLGAANGNGTWMALAKPAARGQCLLVLFAFCCLGYAFGKNDFSVLYVASHSNSALPLQYRLAGIWGGHEGSLLLWTLILTVWMVGVTVFSEHLPEPMRARVIGVLGLVSLGFLLFMLTTSNPFARLIPAAVDGRDLNPLLQDPGMIFHPPMLYMGYVGFSVAFSFAIAALLGGNLDAAWARWSRPWTTGAWCFLTVGIAMGSGWAYYELGWGGWWFWDPVENASFMPWLAGTALMHSLAVTDKRGGFKVWTVFLAILTFSLSLLGTFLVRSGVLTSVHAFATDPARGLFILTFLTIVVGGSLTLFAWRAPRVGLGGKFDVLSRETALLGNNVLLLVAAGTVLLGTLYPLCLDALGLGKISVGPPYFESVFVPIMTPALFLMGIGPLARWKQADIPTLVTKLRWAFGVSLATAVLLPIALGTWTPLMTLGVLLAVWILSTALVALRERIVCVAGAVGIRRVTGVPCAFWGMVLAHCGVAVFIFGVTMVKGLEAETDVRMDVGDQTELAGYTFRFAGTETINGSNYVATRGTMLIRRGNTMITTLYPEKRMYPVQNSLMTEAAIDSGIFRDLYVSLGEPLPGGAWSVRVYYKPFVNWIWGGCLLMACGGIVAVSDRRYRMAWRRERVEAGAGPESVGQGV